MLNSSKTGSPLRGSCVKQCKSPDLAPDQLSAHSGNRISARMSPRRLPCGNELRNAAMGRVGKGWLDGRFPLENEGKILIGMNPQIGIPASRFGPPQGDELRAVDDLERSQTNRAAAARAPVSVPTWDHSLAVIRVYREGEPTVAWQRRKQIIGQRTLSFR